VIVHPKHEHGCPLRCLGLSLRMRLLLLLLRLMRLLRVKWGLRPIGLILGIRAGRPMRVHFVPYEQRWSPLYPVLY